MCFCRMICLRIGIPTGFITLKHTTINCYLKQISEDGPLDAGGELAVDFFVLFGRIFVVIIC